MVLNEMTALRRQYHDEIAHQLLAIREGEVNIADRASTSSRAISKEVADRVGGALCEPVPSAQTSGTLFGTLTRNYLEAAFSLLEKNRPGPWMFKTERPISETDQYKHLADLNDFLSENPELQATLGTDYIITPDIVVYRIPLADEAIGLEGRIPSIATHTPLREANHEGKILPLLHASISCKWTMRSDRAQNTRTEALNLIRNRKGHTPHIMAVTAEPLPMRIASLALGTGDLDCVYHFALYELEESVKKLALTDHGLADQMEMLQTLVNGRRLRDISDLPFDLAI